MFECKICGNIKENKIYYVREMMFSIRDIFQYLYCPACNCLQLNSLPQSFEKYYPSNYYSYSPKYSLLKNYFQMIRNRYYFFQKGIIGRFAILIFGRTELIELLGNYNLSINCKILDVGCGNGRLLKSLRDIGFQKLVGIDPFLDKNYEDLDNLKIYKKNILQLNNSKFDFIMMHHSFEHMSNPLMVLRKANELLEPDGLLLIRIPVLDGEVWRTFRENWVQIDAPRHLFIHSTNSMDFLAKQSGFKLNHITYDSSSFQFWGSRQYKNDIGLYDKRSYLINPSKSIFTSNEIRKYKRISIELNNKNLGDQAAFLFLKAN